MKAKGGVRYVTLWPRSASARYRLICSVHRTLAGARTEAARCEKKGGRKHVIWRVTTARHTGPGERDG